MSRLRYSSATRAQSLPEEGRTQPADARIRIPMASGIESLNAAAAAAVLFYEAARQRNSRAPRSSEVLGERGKARLGLFLFALLAGFVLASVTYRFSREEFIVDNCLSAKHGSFDYAKMSCDLAENHIYIPCEVRHPHDKQDRYRFTYYFCCARIWLSHFAV